MSAVKETGSTSKQTGGSVTFCFAPRVGGHSTTEKSPNRVRYSNYWPRALDPAKATKVTATPNSAIVNFRICSSLLKLTQQELQKAPG